MSKANRLYFNKTTCWELCSSSHAAVISADSVKRHPYTSSDFNITQNIPVSGYGCYSTWFLVIMSLKWLCFWTKTLSTALLTWRVNPLTHSWLHLLLKNKLYRKWLKQCPSSLVCCHRASEELTLMTCHPHLDFRYWASQWHFTVTGKVQFQRKVPA